MGKNYIILEAKVFKNEKVLNDKDLRVYVYEAPFIHELSVFVAGPNVEDRVFESHPREGDSSISSIPHIGDMLVLLSSESVNLNLPYIFQGDMNNSFLYVCKNTGNSICVWVDAEKNVRVSKTIYSEDEAFDKLFYDFAYMLLTEHGIDVLISESFKFSEAMSPSKSGSDNEEVEEEEDVEPEPRKVTVEEVKEVEKQIESLIEKDYSSKSKPDEEKK